MDRRNLYKRRMRCIIMPIKINIEAGLRQLLGLRNRIRELLEWDALAQQEHRRGIPPAFDLHTSVRQEIRDDLCGFYAMFVNLTRQLHMVLARSDLVCTHHERELWEKRLDQIENDVQQLHLSERYLNR